MLKPKEIADLSLALWYLPLEKVCEVAELVRSLKEKHGFCEPIDDSDEWSDEDLREFSVECIKRLDEEDPWEGETSNN